MYKQAILDAKAVRASAMANAKATLQEAFEPKIQEMIRLKLSEELEDEAEMEEGIELEGDIAEEVTDDVDETSLDEILQELDDLAQQDEIGLQEAEEEEVEDETETETEEEETETGDDETEEDVMDDDTKIIDITLGDLKQVLQSIQGQEDFGDEDLGAEDDFGAGDETEETETEDDIDLDEILEELAKPTKKEAKKETKVKEEAKKKTDDKKKLDEAIKTIQVLKKAINEVNVVNAKLLYMNRIFKSKNLSESQKVKVVSALDRAANAKEAKSIYETLKETLSTKRSQIQESKGFASKPAGVAPKTVIVEADAFVNRWQKIAGIK